MRPQAVFTWQDWFYWAVAIIAIGLIMWFVV